MTDLQMPGMSGGELIDRVLQHSPHTPIVVISRSQEDAEAVIAAHGSAALRFVGKPAHQRDLATAIADVSSHTLRR
jgi:FixJ family two-component response regulator